ncbi:MAG: element excision factor XisH family protein [Hormoscilla sp.]
MPAKDIYHETVKTALTKEGWTITDDPLTIQYGSKDLFVDLGIQKLMAAEKRGQKIAVEIKSFRGPSQVNDLQNALGQYMLYRDILEESEIVQPLYLAVTTKAFKEVFEEPLGKLVLTKHKLCLLVFNAINQEVVQWID